MRIDDSVVVDLERERLCECSAFELEEEEEGVSICLCNHPITEHIAWKYGCLGVVSIEKGGQ